MPRMLDSAYFIPQQLFSQRHRFAVKKVANDLPCHGSFLNQFPVIVSEQNQRPLLFADEKCNRGGLEYNWENRVKRPGYVAYSSKG